MDDKKLDDILDENNEPELEIVFDDVMSPEEPPKPDKPDSSRSALIRHIIMIVSLCVFAFSAVMLIITFFKYKDGRDIYTNISNEVIKPNPNRPSGSSTDDEDEEAFLYDHNALIGINRDAVGYLVMPGVGIQLPVVYRAGDNDYYLNHAINGAESMFGSLFIDGHIRDGFKSTHVLIHGHNMYDGSMFAGLAKYRNEDFARDGENSIVYIYSQDKCYTYRVFSVHQVDPTDIAFTINFGSVLAMRDYASKMKQASMYDFGVPITNASQVLTLSTCTSDSKHRFIVHCVLTATKTIKNE